jgi:DNA polymerase III sliding clamp (beta) subunit (PCNA family)
MSTFSISKNQIQPKISLCNQICSKKDPVEVYTHVKVEIKAGILFLSALNSSLFYQTSLTLKSSTTDCEFAIKTDMLSSAVDLIDAEDLDFNFDGQKQTLIIKGKKAKHTLRTNSSLCDDFVNPTSTTEAKQAELIISCENLKTAVQAAMISVGNPKNTYQPEFCNICFSTNSKSKSLCIVSTDRFRITKMVPEFTNLEFNQNNANFKEGQINFLLPPKSLKLAISAIDGNEEAKITFENDFTWIKSASTTLTLSYGQGVFPDYNRIIPESFACNFLINPKEFVSALRQVSLIGNLDTVNKKVKLQVQPNDMEIKLVSDSSNGESSEVTVSLIGYNGIMENWEQSFNAGYLLDYLTNSSEEEIMWESNPTKPSILSPKDNKAKELYLVSGLKS